MIRLIIKDVGNVKKKLVFMELSVNVNIHSVISIGYQKIMSVDLIINNKLKKN